MIFARLVTLHSCHFENLAQRKQSKGKEYSFEEAKAQTLTDAKEEWTVKCIFAVFSMEIQSAMKESQPELQTTKCIEKRYQSGKRFFSAHG